MWEFPERPSSASPTTNPVLPAMLSAAAKAAKSPPPAATTPCPNGLVHRDATATAVAVFALG